MRYVRFSAFLVLLALFAVSPLFAEDLELTSDKMRYESESGDFWADGNVKVTRGTIMATSKTADGNMNRQVFTM